jgi:hypothetical protein
MKTCNDPPPLVCLAFIHSKQTRIWVGVRVYHLRFCFAGIMPIRMGGYLDIHNL